MLNYEIYGYCTGFHVQQIEHKIRHGKPCYEIPLNREHFKPYSDFHRTILKLPYIEEFDNEHYMY